MSHVNGPVALIATGHQVCYEIDSLSRTATAENWGRT
jgi:hypothetical protein